jgi:hypothetical protein
VIERKPLACTGTLVHYQTMSNQGTIFFKWPDPTSEGFGKDMFMSSRNAKSLMPRPYSNGFIHSST